MNEEIKGKCYQEYEPNPDKPCEIKTIVCNDIEIPVEFLKQNFVTVDGKKYIELQQENKQLKTLLMQDHHKIHELADVIDEVEKSLKDYQEYIEKAKKMYSDLDDDNVVKVSCMQILNNQMARNYDLLQILDKVKE